MDYYNLDAKESDHYFMEYQISQEIFLKASYLLKPFTTHPPLCCPNYCGEMEKAIGLNYKLEIYKIFVKSGRGKNITYFPRPKIFDITDKFPQCLTSLRN